MCLLNAHSIKSKSDDFIDLAINTKADLMALTETWLTVDDAVARREIIPSGIKLMDQPRIGCSGGICFVYKKISASKRLKAKKKSLLSLLSLLLRVRHLLQDW